MQQVIGVNATPQDKWKSISSTNMFTLDGMTALEWANAAPDRTVKDFWKIRDARLTENFNRVWGNSFNPANFPLDGLFRMTTSNSSASVAQVLDAMPAWERFSRIQQTGGQAIGFDLETFGDVINGTDKTMFGITEAAIGKRSYDASGVLAGSPYGESFIIGIDESQKKYLDSLVRKMRSGWDNLSQTEQVTLKRMSMYAPKDAIISKSITAFGLNGQQYAVAHNLGAETINADVISAGIRNLHDAYLKSGATPERVLPIITQELINANGDNVVLYGANSGAFDIPALSNAMRTWGIEGADTIVGMKNNILDVIYAAKALSTSNNQSVDTYLQNMYGVRSDGSVGGLLRAMSARNTQEHQGIRDVHNEGMVLDELWNKVIDARPTMEETVRTYSVDKSIFLLHNGSLDHTQAQDFAIVNHAPVSSYSITNEYWQINADRSGYVDIDGQQRYVLTMDSVADVKNGSDNVISFSRTYDSREAALQDLIDNSSVFRSSQVTKKQAREQREFKYKDFGRREFDKLLSPVEVRVDGSEDVYGFASLQKQLTLAQDLRKDGITIDTSPASVQRVLEYVGKYGDETPITSYYQAQAFVGMYDKLINEEPLLSNIVKQVQAVPGANNVDQTIMAYRAYTDSIAYMDETFGRKDASVAYAIMSDALGVDVHTPDGRIKRINVYSPKTATNDVNRILRGLNQEEMLEVIEEIHGRGLFVDDNAYTQIRNNVAGVFTNRERYGLAEDIAIELNKLTSGVLDTRGSVLLTAPKTFNGTLQSIGQNIETDRVIRFNKFKGHLAFGSAYDQVQDAINGIIGNAVQNGPNTVYVNTFGSTDALEQQIRGIARNLNISQGGEEDLLVDIFTKTDKKYAINRYHSQGLRSFIVQPEAGNNAYIFLTQEKDATRFYTKLMDGEFDLTSRKNLIDSGVHDYASFIEISKINEYQLSDGVLRTINQSRDPNSSFEKNIIPELRVDTSGEQIKAYFNNGEYDYLSRIRMSLEGTIKHTLNGDYEAGTRAVRQSQNSYLKDLSASSSYRGYVIENADGTRTIQRIANLGPSDFSQAYRQRVSEGLYSIFKATVNTDTNPQNLNIAQQIVKSFGDAVGTPMTSAYKGNMQRYLSDVANGAEFHEFFIKRLFTGTVANDAFAPSGEAFEHNLFQIIQDMAQNNTSGIFDPSVVRALSRIDTRVVDQVLSESALHKGDISSVRFGEYNDASNLHSTMRPTYGQQNNGMYFGLDEMDARKLIGLEDSVFFDTAVMASKEYDDRMALAASGYNPIYGKDYASQRRSMVAKIKQMGDYDLQLKYANLRANSAAGAKALGISEDTYLKALTYMEQDMMSLYEGKVFIAPGLNEQTLFQSRDAKKITLDIDNLDVEKTEAQLRSLVGKEIDTDTIIGIRRNGAPEYYKGPSTQLFADDVDNLITFGETRIIPFMGDITDNKLMINGSEKGTTHSIVMKKFMEYTGLQNAEALRVANGLFGQVSDGASVIANLGIEKHGNMFGIHSIWNAITTHYLNAGYGNQLASALNAEIANNPAFKGINPYRFENGTLISSSSNADNFAYAVQSIYQKVTNGEFLSPEIDKQIADDIMKMNANDTYFGVIQRQIMNEHMGTRLVVDQRIEQGIRTRGMHIGGDGFDALDNAYADDLKLYALQYDGSGQGFKNSGFGALQTYIDQYSKTKNASRIPHSAGQTDVQRSVKGIVESLMYYDKPFDVDAQNIVKININDLIQEETRLKAGMSTSDLHGSIFFVDGKPSELLQRLAKDYNVDIMHQSYSIFLDLNQTTFTANKNTFNGMLIPIQSVFSNSDDLIFFQNQQKAVTSLLNRVVEVTTNPGDKDIASALSTAYTAFIEQITPETATMKKTSDVYKALQQYIVPTSQQLLAQDEAAPLVRDMMDEEMQGLITKRRRLESDLAQGYDAAKVAELDEVYTSIEAKLAGISNRILNDDEYYSDLMSLRGNLSEASKVVIDVNGKAQTHYGLAVAISEEAFERQGYNLGVVGLDVFADFETGKGQIERIAEFNQRHNLETQAVTIARQLNDLGIDDLVIDEQQPIIAQLDKFIRNKYDLNGSMLNIEDLNKAAIKNAEQKRILDVFRPIGIDYMSEIGTFTDIVRYPAFRSQPLVRLLVDSTLSGAQLRASNAILSSLSNVDFDGDTMFLASIADGMSILKTGDARFQRSKQIYERFATNESRQLLSELVKDGEVFNVDKISNLARQSTAMLEKFKKGVYESAMMQWATDNGIHVSSVDELTQAQRYAASSSSRMIDTFNSIKFNTILDEDTIVASLAARFRKENIGSISTPNYTLRNAILTAMQDPAMKAEQKQLLNDAYVNLSNMLSKAGGFFSMAEQKSIDVKHVSDGLDIARTTRYATGISQLFSEKVTKESNLEAIYNILLATNSGIFKASEHDLRVAASLIVEVPKDSLAAVMELNGFSSKTIPYYSALKDLLTIQEQIPGFHNLYNDALSQGTLHKAIYDTIRQLNEQDFDTLSKRYYGTAMYNVLDIFANSFSKAKSPYVINDIYIRPGRIVKESLYDDMAYVYKGNGLFQGFDLKTMKETNEKIRRPGQVTATGANVRDYIQSATIRGQVDDARKTLKLESLLNDMTVTKKGKVRTSMPQAFIDIGRSNGKLDRFGSETWSYANRLFGDGARDVEMYEQLTALVDTFQYAKNKGFSMNNAPASSGELLKQINHDIATNPEKYANSTMDMIVRDTLLSKDFFGSQDIFDRYFLESQQMDGFDIKKYREYLGFLNQEAYDTIEQETRLRGSFKSVDIELTGLQRQGATDEELQPLRSLLQTSEQDIKTVLSTLEKENSVVIKKHQDDIYKLFKNTNQMDTFFGWGKRSGQSVVGFGTFIGKQFSELSETDVDYIVKEGAKISASASAKEQHAVSQTLDALKHYRPVKQTSSARSFVKPSQAVADIESRNLATIHKVLDGLSQRTEEDLKKAASRAKASTQKKTLSGSVLTSAKEAASKIPKKAVGITIGAMAAIGIANNLLHNQKTQSPLTPARMPNGNGAPDISGNYPEHTPAQAPMSKKKVVYHDKQSGFNFKVSAQTRKHIDDMNNAKLIGMTGGGNPSVYTQSDTSGVTDNWLANKFAELT